MYSFCFRSTSEFSIMNIPFLNFMHPVEEDVFYNIFFIIICLSAMCMFCSVCITVHFLISWCYSMALFAVSFISTWEFHVINFFWFVSLYLGCWCLLMSLEPSLNVFHFKLLTFFKFLYSTISAHIWSTIRKRDIMKKRALENLTLTVPTEGNRNR